MAAAMTALLCALCASGVTLSPSYRDCEKGYTNEIRADKDRNANNATQISAVNRVGNLIDCESVFANKNGAAITAIATVFLTAATILLGWLAYDQGHTARAQLRAYVSAVPIKAALLRDDRTIVAIVPMKNTGQSPAFQFQDLSNLLVLPYPINEHIPFNPEKESPARPNPTYVIYPGVEHANAPRLTLEWPDTIRMMTEGFALYVFGRMTYLDAFRRPQWAEFCAVLEPKEFWEWTSRAMADPDRQPVPATFKFTKGNNRASF